MLFRSIPYRPDVCRALHIIDWCGFTPVSATKLCSSFRVIVVLSVVSLTESASHSDVELGGTVLSRQCLIDMMQLPFCSPLIQQSSKGYPNMWIIFCGLFQSCARLKLYLFFFKNALFPQDLQSDQWYLDYTEKVNFLMIYKQRPVVSQLCPH